jgi:hypothetical protein
MGFIPGMFYIPYEADLATQNIYFQIEKRMDTMNWYEEKQGRKLQLLSCCKPGRANSAGLFFINIGVLHTQ